MNIHLKRYFVCVIAALLLCNCRAILSKIYGIHYLKKFDLSKYNQFISKTDTAGIDFYHFYADSNSYKCVRNMSKSVKVKNNFGQPVQLIYFKNDSLISCHANCYVREKKRLKLELCRPV